MTSTALDLNHGSTALAIQPGQITWDAAQAAALAQLGLADAGDGDRAVFLHVSQRTGLDPFARQIYMIPRREKIPGTQNWRTKWTIQTGIEGWRVIRDRAERRYGVRGTLSRAIWYDGDGTEHKVWVRPDPPAACELTYTVRDATGAETPYTSVLQFREYAQTGSDGSLIAQWGAKKSHMLEKCTEADVYRKAFPQDFSGIYLDDAMPQDTPQDGVPPNGGRPRGRVTTAEVLDRTDHAPAASDEGAKEEDHAADLEPGEAAEYGTERHQKLIGVVRKNLVRFGYPITKDETDEQRAARLEVTAKLAGVAEIGSSSDLDTGELSKVADTLARCKNREALDALLEDGEAGEAT